MEVSENFFGPQVDAAFSRIAMCQLDDRDSLRPEKQQQGNDPEPDRDAAVGRDGGHDVQIEDRDYEQQHQIPTPQNTFEMRLLVGVGRQGNSGKCFEISKRQGFNCDWGASLRRAGEDTRPYLYLLICYPCPSISLLVHGDGGRAFLLRFGQGGREVLEGREMFINVGLAVLDGNGPLLVPPLGLRRRSAAPLAERAVPPQVDGI